MKKQIELGDLVRDRVTKFQGVAIAKSEWLNGCTKWVVQPEKLDGGKIVDSVAFDEGDIEVVRKAAVLPTPELVEQPKKKTGGPSTLSQSRALLKR